nr:integrase, catalytic region, zinc finger, CCHC-type, peptidase aspartic, catalytic [Tanacetum cinerariifolium]
MANVSKSISIPNEDLSDDTTPSFAHTFLNEILELEIERLLKVVVSQDIISVVQNASIVDTSDLQTELERTKERFENCIIKKETEYTKLWNDWYKKCNKCKYDKISYDKSYKDMQQKIERLQAQLGDLKVKCKDTSCVSDTLNPLSQKLENENVELEFQVLNYARENAHFKATYKNLFDSISVSRVETETKIASLQNELQSNIYKNAKLRTQLFKKVSDQKENTQDSSNNTKFAKQPNVEIPPKIGETNALSKPVTSNSISTPQVSKGVNNDKKEVDELKAERLAKTQDPLALMANSNNPYAFPAPYQDQSSHNQNYLQQPMPNLEDITNPTTAINMALTLLAKAFKLNYSTPTNNNQMISSNPKNRQIAQLGMNMGQDRQMQMNIGNQHVMREMQLDKIKPDKVLQLQGEEAGIQLQAEEYDLMAAAADLDEIEEVIANCNLMANLQQASTSGTQTDSTPVYDSDGSAEQAQKKQQSLYDGKVLLEKHDPSVVHDSEETLQLAQETKFVRDFKSLANKADASLAKYKALEFEIECLLKAVVRVDNTKTRRPQPRINRKHDRVPSASKSSRSKNKEVKVEEHHRNLLLSKNNKHISSACKNIKIDSQDVISKVVCAMCKKCLIFVNDDECLSNYVNGKNYRGKKQKAKVSFKENTNEISAKGYEAKEGKSKRASHPLKPVPNSRLRLHLLHMDLRGPMRIASINGKQYVLVIVDDYSRYTWVPFLRSKDEAPENHVLKEYFDTVGISHQMSSVQTPQQNGVVERRNQMLVEAARTTLIFSRTQFFLWAEAIGTACFTQNRSIIHRRFNKTPYELINGRKPDISFLHVFGALCYPKNDHEDIGKLGARCDIGFFIGYSADSCAYRIYNRSTKKIMETMNVLFDELSAMAFEQRSSKPRI